MKTILVAFLTTLTLINIAKASDALQVTEKVFEYQTTTVNPLEKANSVVENPNQSIVIMRPSNPGARGLLATYEGYFCSDINTAKGICDILEKQYVDHRPSDPISLSSQICLDRTGNIIDISPRSEKLEFVICE